MSRQNLDTLNLVIASRVVILSVPTHTTHILQPLDVAVYRPFKTAFEIVVDMYKKNHPRRGRTQFEINGIVETATNMFRMETFLVV